MNVDLFTKMGLDPTVFRQHLLIPTAAGPVPFAHCMADFQRRDFEALDGALLRLAGRPVGSRRIYTRAWIERTKSGSKDTDTAVAALWVLAFSSRRLTLQVGAVDSDQAALVRSAAEDIIRANEWLSQLVQVNKWQLTAPRSGSQLDILAHDIPGAHGARPHAVWLNEIHAFQKRDFADVLIANVAKNPNTLLTILTNAGFGDSWQSKLRDEAQSSGRWYYSVMSEPAPWLSADDVAEQERLLPPLMFRRLYRGEWTSGSGDALDPADIDRAIVCKGPLLRRKPGHVVVAGVDIGVRRDASGLVVCSKSVGMTSVHERYPNEDNLSRAHRAAIEVGFMEMPPDPEQRIRTIRGTGRVRVCRVKLWKPKPGKSKVSIEAVVRYILAQHEIYQFDAIAYDPHQFEHGAEMLEKEGINMVRVSFTGAALMEIAATTLGAFSGGEIALYPDPDLIADLRALRCEEKAYGFRLVSPRQRGMHGDSVSALCLALLAAKQFNDPEGDQMLPDVPLIYT